MADTTPHNGSAGTPAAPSPPAARLAVWIFTPTILLSALLLFSIQPMFARMVLPVLGGGPSVWAVALVFFQAALLAGYAYAHLLMRTVPFAWTGWVHLALTALAIVSLPIGLPQGWVEPPPGDPYLWQLGLFAVAIGLPFTMVAANAPLLQAWFAATGHRSAGDPYFLYAASNLGSLLALLSYPPLLEPAFGVSTLAVIWSGGFIVLMAGLATAFGYAERANRAPTRPLSSRAMPEAEPPRLAGEAPEGRPAGAPSWPQRLGWIGLSLVPSALLTAFTTHVTTDVASAPLLWVIPLAVYLATFVVVFRPTALIAPRLLLILHLSALLVALLQLAQTRHEGWVISSAAGFAAFVFSTLVAHRTLYEQRPAARHLTTFYLCMSLGGVLGGLFAALIAPRLFSEVYEYPLLLALTVACRPGMGAAAGILWRALVGMARALGLPAPASWTGLDEADGRELAVIWVLTASGVLVVFWVPTLIHLADIDLLQGWGTAAPPAVLFAALVLVFWGRPLRQFAMVLLMFVSVVMLPSGAHRGEAQRSYFGVYRVALSHDGQFNILMHGTTLHGAQRIHDAEMSPVADSTPATYYYPDGPMAQSIFAQRAVLGAAGRLGRYGVIGLGTGSLACHARPGETWRFFEIDPLMTQIAQQSGHFTFLANCQPLADIVIGDARLTLAREDEASFDLLVVDAFTSDAVPVHLLTREALALYGEKVAHDGVVVLHISNRYLDLKSVLSATLATMPGFSAIVISDDDPDESYAASASTIVVVARDSATLAPFKALSGSSDLSPAGDQRPWTDDHADIFGPLIGQLSR